MKAIGKDYGEPFARGNAMRVRRMAWTAIAAELLRAGIIFYENSYAIHPARRRSVADGLRVEWPFASSSIICCSIAD